MASPLSCSKLRSTDVATTWVAMSPKPIAATTAKAMTKTHSLEVEARRKHPAASKARPVASTLRAPWRSTSLPASGVIAAMTTSAMAAAPEMKLRDQPSSRIQVVIVRPRVARTENATARVRKPSPTVSHGPGSRFPARLSMPMVDRLACRFKHPVRRDFLRRRSRGQALIDIGVDRPDRLLGGQILPRHGAAQPESVDPDADPESDLLGPGPVHQTREVMHQIAAQTPVDGALQPFEL